MAFDPHLADIRFGAGLSPVLVPPASRAEMLERLSGPDLAAAAFPIPTYQTVFPNPADLNAASRAVNAARGTDDEQSAIDARNELRAVARDAVAHFAQAQLARDVTTADGFRERLVRFWADHFTVRAVSGGARHLISPHVEEVIRPHIAGRFGDLLVSAIVSPLMVYYLDQHQSMGPNSQTAQRRDRGLNENLARELLELHTLGVGGSYTQTDVRELAELLTGLTANVSQGAYFREQQAEPGPETVLGVTYGGSEESLAHITAALQDLARHPDTARHLARKLVVHFISPTPDVELIEAMAQAYLASDGGLMSLYEVMLGHPSAWEPTLAKVKQPYDFVSSALRALNVPSEDILGASLQDVRRLVFRPLAVMGQTWQTPVGPDGWPEDEDDWITPQGMAGRITWAMHAPRQLVYDLPDPRDFVGAALGPLAPDAVVFAANAAETISDGIGIVLASAAFQRR